MSDHIDWPEEFKPFRGEFHFLENQSRFRSPFTGQEQILNKQGGRWVATWSFRLFERESRKMDALLLKSGSGNRSFKIWDLRNATPTGTAKTASDWVSEMITKSASVSVSGATSWQSWYTSTFSPTVPEDFSDGFAYSDGTGHDTSSDCTTPKLKLSTPWGVFNSTAQPGSTEVLLCGFEPGSTVATDGDTVTIGGESHTANGTNTASIVDGSVRLSLKSPGMASGLFEDDDGNDFVALGDFDPYSDSTWSATSGETIVTLTNWAPSQTIFVMGDYIGRQNFGGSLEFLVFLEDVVTDSSGDVTATVHKSVTDTFSNEEPVVNQVPILMRLASTESTRNPTVPPYTVEQTLEFKEDLS